MYQAPRLVSRIRSIVINIYERILGKSISKNKNNEIALLNYVDGKDICIVL